MASTRTMSLAAIACIAGAVAYGTPPGFAQSTTDTKVFEAFKAFCSPDLLDVEAARRRAIAYGWKPADDSDSPRLVARRRFATTMLRFASSDLTHRHLFKFTAGERLIFGEMTAGAKTGVHFCDVYDFDAVASFSALVRQWLDVEPTKARREPGYVYEEWYRPNTSKQFLRVHTSFAPSTPNGEKVGWVGARLGVSQVEKSRDKF